MATSAERICENDPCSNQLTGEQERFCSDRCRFEQWDRQHPRTPASVPYNGSGGRRRASRDGKGARVYLTRSELIYLWAGRIPESVSKKTWAAMERVR